MRRSSSSAQRISKRRYRSSATGQVLGISLDWDGCGTVLLALLSKEEYEELERKEDIVFMPAIVKQLEEDGYETNVRHEIYQRIAKALINKIRTYLKDSTTVYLFVGSNRQSITIDNMEYDVKEEAHNPFALRSRAFACFPYVALILQRELSEQAGRTITVEFKRGLVADHNSTPKYIPDEYGTAMSDPNKIVSRFDGTEQ